VGRIGYYKGKHFTEYVETVKSLKREGKLDEAETLLLGLIDAMEAEEKEDKCGVAPGYYERLAMIYRKQQRYGDEVATLERFAEQRKGPGAKVPKLLERLNKARELLSGK
jgi:hypothetical protein